MIKSVLFNKTTFYLSISWHFSRFCTFEVFQLSCALESNQIQAYWKPTIWQCVLNSITLKIGDQKEYTWLNTHSSWYNRNFKIPNKKSRYSRGFLDDHQTRNWNTKVAIFVEVQGAALVMLERCFNFLPDAINGLF